MRIDVLLFEGFDELDAVGPFEVFATAADEGADCDPRLVTRDGDPVEASHGLRVDPHGRPREDPGLLVVPGGGWSDPGPGARAEYEDGAVSELVAARHGDGADVASVCTGAMLLSRAGLLDGRPATTHAVARDDLAAAGADLRDARVVDDGDVLTSGGVTAGLDLAVHLVERELGASVATAVCEELEYDPSGDVLGE